MKDWYSIKTFHHGGVEINIYDEIGANGISAKEFIDSLKNLGGVSSISVRINSPGGSVTDGIAIYNALKRQKANIDVHIDGAAFSIASVIAMAGNKVHMAENAFFMIHNPWSMAYGDSADMRKTADVMDKMKDSLITAYANKTGEDRELISEMMDEETWFDAQEALNHGFIDVITDAMDVAASFDVSKFNNVPTNYFKGDDMSQQKQSSKTENSIDAEAISKELDRVNLITDIFMTAGDEYKKMMVSCLQDKSCSTEMAREKLLVSLGERHKPANPRNHCSEMTSIHYGDNNHHQEFRDAAVDGLCLRNNVNIKNPSDAAKDVSRMSIMDMASQMLRHQGKSTQGLSSTDILNTAYHTTSDFPSLLSDSMGKTLRMAYEEMSPSFESWTRVEYPTDFKPQNRPQLSEAPDLEVSGEHAELTYGTFGESNEVYELQTFKKAFALTRESLINDDLDAFFSVPRAFISSAIRKQGDIVYQQLTSNPTMHDNNALFHASHNNLMSAAALDISSLSTARASMLKQKTSQGSHLSILPKHLIVPAELLSTAEQLVASMVDPSRNNEVPNLKFIRNLEVVVDPRLDDDSTTAWYLAADTRQIDTVVRAYLGEGNVSQGIHLSQREGFEFEGIEFKILLDFAAKALDWRGLIKNPGA